MNRRGRFPLQCYLPESIYSAADVGSTIELLHPSATLPGRKTRRVREAGRPPSGLRVLPAGVAHEEPIGIGTVQVERV